MKNSFKRSDFTGITSRFLRSINLYNDWHNAESFSGYIVTPNVAQSLERLFYGLLTPNGQRAFALIGPYGTGKSAFLVFICQLFSQSQDQALTASKHIPADFDSLVGQIRESRNMKSGREGFLPITVTARRRPIAQLILSVLNHVFRDLKSDESQPKLSVNSSL